MPLPIGPVVGTCGFSHPAWRGRFYPPDLPQRDWLAFYARVFRGVELDATFYRLPQPQVVAGWAERLPERFGVAVKAPQAITHEARLAEPAAALLREFARALEPLGDRLLAVLLQLPPSLGADEGRERLAALLDRRPAGLPVAVEVRHRSWDRPWLGRLLRDAGAELALADRPGEVTWPGWWRPVRYLRLLGDRRAAPAGGRRPRERPADLDRWAALLAEAARQGGGPVAAFASDRFEGAAFLTAAALRRRLGQPVVEPASLWNTQRLPGL